MKNSLLKESKLRKYKNKAATFVEKGKYKKALVIYQDILESFPDDTKIMLKVADLCRTLKMVDQAKAVYSTAVKHHAAAGQLLQAIAICRVILEMQPDDAVALEDLKALQTRKYGIELPAASADAEDTEVEVEIEIDVESSGDIEDIDDGDVLDDDIIELDDDMIVDEDQDVVIRLTRPSVVVDELPHIPLFSALESDAFEALVSELPLRSFDALDTIVKEGDAGDSFFIIVSGSVEIFKDETSVAELEDGAFFGEMAVIVPGVRQASVVAIEPCRLFEVTNEHLDRLKADFPEIESQLVQFAEERLLNNLLLTSPLFIPFSEDDQRSLIEKFKPCFYKEGESIIRENENPDGLYLLVSGEVSVTGTGADGQTIDVAILKAGDVFGEISLLSKKPATATVTTKQASRMLMLPSSKFNELIMTHPQILELISSISDERLDQLQSLKQRPAASSKNGGTALL